jgi:CspA family cold shock protein
MPTGSIILFKEDKGYGFIRPKDSEDPKENVYVHISSLQEVDITAVTPGQRVNYELQTDDNGKVSATSIQLL